MLFQFKNTEISRRIIAETMKGATLQQAIDSVLGEGTYAKLAAELYDQRERDAALLHSGDR